MKGRCCSNAAVLRKAFGLSVLLCVAPWNESKPLSWRAECDLGDVFCTVKTRLEPLESLDGGGNRGSAQSTLTQG